MVVVPNYTRNVADRPAFQQQITARATPDDFGAAIGRGMQGLAQGGQQVADAFQQIAELEDVTAAKEADNALAEWSREAMYGDGGFMTLEGRSAVDARAEFEKTWEEKRREIGSGLRPGAARHYGDASQARRQSVLQSTAVHSANARKTWVKEASAARVDTFGEDALANFGDPVKVDFNIAAAQAELRQQAELEGWDADTLRNRETEFISGVHHDIAMRMLINDPLAAQKYADEHTTELTGPHQFDLEKALEVPVMTETAKQEAARITEAINSGADTNFEDDLAAIEDDDVRELTRSAITGAFEAQAKAEKAQKDAMTEQAYKLIETQGMNPFELPPEITTEIGREGMKELMDWWNKRQTGEAIRTNDRLMYELQDTYARDPAGFSSVDLMPYRSQLSDEDWAKVTGWRQTALTDQRKAGEEGGLIGSVMEQAKPSFEAVGLILAGDSRQANAEKIATFNVQLAKELEVFARDNGGKVPTYEERQHIIDTLMLPVAVQKKGDWWMGGADHYMFEVETMGDGTRFEVRVNYQDIPYDLRLQLQSDMTIELGTKPSEEQVVTRYEELFVAGQSNQEMFDEIGQRQVDRRAFNERQPPRSSLR